MTRKADTDLIRTLLEDAMSAAAHLDLTNQSSKRNLIRTTYAAIEGIAWHLASHVASIAADTDQLTAAEELALSEKGYQVTRQGKVSEQIKVIPLPSLIRLAANIAQRVDEAFETDFETNGWNRFIQGLEIRNRITHPKSAADLFVSEADVAIATAALYWILELTEHAMMLTISALRQYQNDLNEMIHRLEAGDPVVWAEYLAAAKQIGD